MKIAIVHYRFYEASGPEKYLFRIKAILEQKGHKVIPFSLNYPQNQKTVFSKYFVNPIVSDFHLHKTKISIVNKIKIIKQGFYNKTAYNQLSTLIKSETPDVIYVLQYGIKLSTSVFDACQDHNVPVVLRLSDYNLICAKNILFRNGKVCQDCLKGYCHGLKNKCVHGSFIQSLIFYSIQKFNQIQKFEKNINCIIAPSEFTISQLRKSKQYKSSRFEKIPTFHTQQKVSLIPRTIQNRPLKLCYWGRIEEDKGIDILIDAIKYLKDKGTIVNLKIIGNYNLAFAELQIKKKEKLELDNIHFAGYVSNENILMEVSDAHFSVIPSKWYDNMPNSLIESCSIGIPVIVSDHGSLSELIIDGFNGFKFEANNPNELAKKILFLTKMSDEDYNKISKNSQEWVLDYCDPQKHYESLVKTFTSVINENNSK